MPFEAWGSGMFEYMTARRFLSPSWTQFNSLLSNGTNYYNSHCMKAARIVPALSTVNTSLGLQLRRGDVCAINRLLPSDITLPNSELHAICNILSARTDLIMHCGAAINVHE